MQVQEFAPRPRLFDTSSSFFSGRDMDSETRDLLARLQKNSQSLVLNFQQLDDTRASLIAANLPVRIHLTATIVFSMYSFSKFGPQKNNSLTLIDLSINAIGDAGAVALSQALNSTTCPRLAHLRLSHNQVFESFSALSCFLSVLYIFGEFDQIGTIGAQALAAAISSHPTLTCVDLRNNAIECAGAQVRLKFRSLRKKNLTNESLVCFLVCVEAPSNF
jgi:hypothetical protein